MGESKILYCPECGEESFSWIVEQVQFGPIHEFENGSRSGEGMEMGPIVDSEEDSDDGVFCTTCENEYDIDELLTGEGDEPEQEVLQEQFNE